MEARILQRDRLPAFVDALIRGHEVIAPRDELSYGRVESASEVFFSDGKPAKSLKEFLLPEREVLFEYHLEGEKTKLVEPPSLGGIPRVIFGARPCDAAALPILDKVFTWDYLDSTYLRRRKYTAIISLACAAPAKSCFCVSVGGSPAGTEGSDLLLTPLADVYHVQIITEQGKALVEAHKGFFQDSDEKRDRQRVFFEEEAKKKLTKNVDVKGGLKGLVFDNPAWQTITQQCVDCGICTFLCPTCHCFDIQDEGNSDEGARIRLWDSCAFRSFTKMAVYQPRPTHYSRYRQRIMHKFKYYPDNFGRTLCVGCGRCIQYCPVGIDIRNVLNMVKE